MSKYKLQSSITSDVISRNCIRALIINLNIFSTKMLKFLCHVYCFSGRMNFNTSDLVKGLKHKYHRL